MSKWATYLFLAIIAVLIITHASDFAAAVTAVGGQTYDETDLLTGASSASNVTSVSSSKAGVYSIAG